MKPPQAETVTANLPALIADVTPSRVAEVTPSRVAEVTPDGAAAAAPDSPPPPARKKRRDQVRYKIRRLPRELRDEVERRLREKEFGSYRELSAWLAANGHDISFSALHTYHQAHEADWGLEAVKRATVQALAIVEECGIKDEQMNRSLTRLVQTLMFNMLVAVNQLHGVIEKAADARSHSGVVMNAKAEKIQAAGDPSAKQVVVDERGNPVPRYPTRAELDALKAVGRVVAMFEKQQMYINEDIRRQEGHNREQLALVKERVTQAVSAGGLSPEAETQIRAALMEIEL